MSRVAIGTDQPRTPSIFDHLGSSQVRVPNPTEVLTYLAEYPRLAHVIPQVCGQVRQGLGADKALSLELYHDPESQEQYLTLYVRQITYDADIVTRINAVSDQFDELLGDVPGYLLITTDFRSPRAENAF